MEKRATIVDRLQMLMDGRDKYPWGHSIGLGKGVIDGMTRTGSTPGGDTLGAIGRCENARIDWILDGRGAPFTVSCVTSDEAAAELLGQLLEEPDWRITIVSDQVRIALVLDQGGSFDVKDGKDEGGAQRYRTIEYSIVEVLVGQLGRRTMELVRAQPFVNLAYAPAEVFTLLERGRFGTWRLLQHPQAILKGAQRIDARHPIFDTFDQPGLFPSSDEEAMLLGHYRAMTPENRHAVHQVVTAMEKYESPTPPKGNRS